MPVSTSKETNRWQTRILRSVKNRFGTRSELGFFQMEEHGLQEVPNNDNVSSLKMFLLFTWIGAY